MIKQQRYMVGCQGMPTKGWAVGSGRNRDQLIDSTLVPGDQGSNPGWEKYLSSLVFEL